jgi:hypothetical protein
MNFHHRYLNWLPYWQLETRRCSNTLKGSQRMGRRWIFLKNLRASLFNDDLWNNEPNFSKIHLAGQYLQTETKHI